MARIRGDPEFKKAVQRVEQAYRDRPLELVIQLCGRRNASSWSRTRSSDLERLEREEVPHEEGPGLPEGAFEVGPEMPEEEEYEEVGPEMPEDEEYEEPGLPEEGPEMPQEEEYAEVGYLGEPPEIPEEEKPEERPPLHSMYETHLSEKDKLMQEQILKVLQHEGKEAAMNSVMDLLSTLHLQHPQDYWVSEGTLEDYMSLFPPAAKLRVAARAHWYSKNPPLRVRHEEVGSRTFRDLLQEMPVPRTFLNRLWNINISPENWSDRARTLLALYQPKRWLDQGYWKCGLKDPDILRDFHWNVRLSCFLPRALSRNVATMSRKSKRRPTEEGYDDVRLSHRKTRINVHGHKGSYIPLLISHPSS